MKSSHPIFLFIVVLFFQACEKELIVPEEKEYEEGLLMVEKKAEAPLNTFFDLLNSYDFPINRISGHYYVSHLPSDSLHYVNNTLSGKSYLNKAGWSGGAAYLSNNEIHLYPWFSSMNRENQQDWLLTIEQLKLIEDAAHPPYFFVEVPVGMEEYWRDELKKSKLIASVDMVYFVDFSASSDEE